MDTMSVIHGYENERDNLYYHNLSHAIIPSNGFQIALTFIINTENFVYIMKWILQLPF